MGPDWLRGERQDEGKGRVARNAGYGHGVWAEGAGASAPARLCREEGEQGLSGRAGLGPKAAESRIGRFCADTLRNV